jgi:hypothetical protein
MISFWVVKLNVFDAGLPSKAIGSKCMSPNKFNNKLSSILVIFEMYSAFTEILILYLGQYYKTNYKTYLHVRTSNQPSYVSL